MGASKALVLENQPNFLAEPVPLDMNPAVVYLAMLAPGSRRTMRGSLDLVARMVSHGVADAVSFNWAALRFQHTAAIRAKLAATYRHSTANKILSAVRGVLKVAYGLGTITPEDYARAVSFKPVHGEVVPTGRALELHEIEALMDACARDPSPAGTRDAAILAVMRAGGLRRAEICDLNVADFDRREVSLLVRGKLNKERQVPLSEVAASIIEEWLTIRGESEGPLFCPVRKHGAIASPKRLSPQALYKCLRKRAQQAGLHNLSPHDFRRTFVSDLLDAGADISVVQKLAGHSNVQTTARYDRRGTAAKRKAVNLLNLPYRKQS